MSMACREALTIGAAVYRSARGMALNLEQELPSETASELATYAAASPWMETDLAVAWNPKAYMVDAAEPAGCIAWTRVSDSC